EVLAGVRELERAVDAVVVGERERVVAELGGARGELLRQRRAVEERVRRVCMELDVPGPGTRRLRRNGVRIVCVTLAALAAEREAVIGHALCVNHAPLSPSR